MLEGDFKLPKHSMTVRSEPAVEAPKDQRMQEASKGLGSQPQSKAASLVGRSFKAFSSPKLDLQRDKILDLLEGHDLETHPQFIALIEGLNQSVPNEILKQRAEAVLNLLTKSGKPDQKLIDAVLTLKDLLSPQTKIFSDSTLTRHEKEIQETYQFLQNLKQNADPWRLKTGLTVAKAWLILEPAGRKAAHLPEFMELISSIEKQQTPEVESPVVETPTVQPSKDKVQGESFIKQKIQKIKDLAHRLFEKLFPKKTEEEKPLVEPPMYDLAEKLAKSPVTIPSDTSDLEGDWVQVEGESQQVGDSEEEEEIPLIDRREERRIQVENSDYGNVQPYSGDEEDVEDFFSVESNSVREEEVLPYGGLAKDEEGSSSESDMEVPLHQLLQRLEVEDALLSEKDVEFKYEILHFRSEILAMTPKLFTAEGEEPGRVIGKGNYGEVRLEEYDGQQCVVKYSNEMNTLEDLRNQLREIYVGMQASAASAVTVKILGVKLDPNGMLNPVTEFYPGGNLAEKLKKDRDAGTFDGSISTVIKRLVPICKGMSDLHQAKIAHQDLAARNILLKEDGSPVLADFGLSRQLKEDGLGNTLRNTGPIRWMAPESILYKQYSEKSDVWMFAMTAVEVITGEPPYPRLNNNQIAAIIVSEEEPNYRVKFTTGNEAFDALLTRCTAYLPEDRPTFNEAYTELERIRATITV